MSKRVNNAKGRPSRNRMYSNIKYALWKKRQEALAQAEADEKAEKIETERAKKRLKDRPPVARPWRTKARQFFARTINRGARGR